ncbi:MAG: RsmG family class I SAM-dependent methyltransferase [Nannocystaceae bacterium]
MTRRSSLEAVLAPQLQGLDWVEPLDATAWARLEKLAALWLRYGRVMNLTAAKSAEELAPHVIEALMVVALARRVGLGAGSRWLDVGSGAGLPGLVIAALLDVELTMIEPRERRASFLEVALAQIDRPARVLRGHLDENWRPLPGTSVDGAAVAPNSYSAVSARAVFPPDRWLEVAPHWVTHEGWVFAHFSAQFKQPEEIKYKRRLFFDQWSVCLISGSEFGNK